MSFKSMLTVNELFLCISPTTFHTNSLLLEASPSICLIDTWRTYMIPDSRIIFEILVQFSWITLTFSVLCVCVCFFFGRNNGSSGCSGCYGPAPHTVLLRWIVHTMINYTEWEMNRQVNEWIKYTLLTFWWYPTMPHSRATLIAVNMLSPESIKHLLLLTVR